MEVRLPLYHLFRQLKEARLDLSMDQYLLALRLVGLEMKDKEHLQRLLQTIWTTSKAEAFTLDIHFNRLFADYETASLFQPYPDAIGGQPEPPEDTLRPGQASEEGSPARFSPGEELQSAEGPGDFSTADAPSWQTAADLYLPPEATRREFILTPTFTPVEERELLQSWKYLQRRENGGWGRELDVPAIVAQVSRQGFYLNPCYRFKPLNSFRLFLLIDRGGSMIAFHALGDQLAASVAGFAKLPGKNIFYFHDQPNDVLYRDATLKDPITVKKWQKSLSAKNDLVLIISDGGAARASFSAERIGLTFEFVSRVAPGVRQMAWLNPTPQSRWTNSSATFIQQFIPMFETNGKGLRQATDHLKGRPL